MVEELIEVFIDVEEILAEIYTLKDLIHILEYITMK
jgi:hypothetical protein